MAAMRDRSDEKMFLCCQELVSALVELLVSIPAGSKWVRCVCFVVRTSQLMTFVLATHALTLSGIVIQVSTAKTLLTFAQANEKLVSRHLVVLYPFLKSELLEKVSLVSSHCRSSTIP
jgi:hypothetical protein